MMAAIREQEKEAKQRMIARQKEAARKQNEARPDELGRHSLAEGMGIAYPEISRPRVHQESVL